jgi:uncharacterized SAM-binding protein YcdF (DUF218 family)
LSLSPVASVLVVPPLNLLLVSLAGAAIALRRARGLAPLGAALLGIGLFGLAALALPITADNLLVGLESGLPLGAAGKPPPGAIVILAGDVAKIRGETPETEVGPLTLERLRAGAALSRHVGLPILVTGGVPAEGGLPIATLMAQSLAQDFATPVRWTETASSDTWENARDSAAILAAAGIRSVYLVTHAWHMRRAALAFVRFGIAVTAAPVRLDAPPAARFDAFVPQAKAWMMSYFALHEWIGCVYYARRG